MTEHEGVLDPWVEEWLATNPLPSADFSDEFLAMARGSFDMPVGCEIARIRDDEVAGVRVRIYEHDADATALVVYLHGGGWCVGSISLMDNVARELAHATGAAVISVEYPLAPEHPYPEGLDACEAVTRWALANASAFRTTNDRVLIAGESAGGNLATAVALRLRDHPALTPLAGQILIYPAVDAHGSDHPSRHDFYGLVITEEASEWYWRSYTAGRPLEELPFAAPLLADDLASVPPSLIVLAGCDVFRDEGRAYAQRLRDAGVEVTEICCAGQPHGFVNFMFPAAAEAFDLIGTWVRSRVTETK